MIVILKIYSEKAALTKFLFLSGGMVFSLFVCGLWFLRLTIN